MSPNEELPPRLARSLFDLDGRVAVVTGGAGILGRSFVAALSTFGAKVALLDLDAAKAHDTVEAIAQNGLAPPLAISCDIGAVEELKAAVERIEGELGPIDILLNNAATKGKNIRSFFAEDTDYTLETWREVMAVNIDAMFLVAQEVGRRMIARRKGTIVQTASIYGMLGPDPRIYDGSEYLGGAIRNPAVYSTSKAAVLGLTRHLATVWAPFGIRVNALTPGGVSSGQNSLFSDKYSARVPLGRMARADDMVGAAVFLASDASSYITGQNIVVDGGLSVW